MVAVGGEVQGVEHIVEKRGWENQFAADCGKGVDDPGGRIFFFGCLAISLQNGSQ